ncbi:hypothetical protein [Dictyobacter formicarum]|uniref:ABC transporter Uup C-terminal domain-containing protein n=1 Tax=Dictyobacter formicarum TaxID=2778368 RepID=A0ABQ3VJM8_9CHLR|nr:hypothetical protein [Dictyobacter formicarum]GHO85321.1 hypothetical protein KSZ_33270 [Dictyobacter formicarum]
MLFHEPEDIEPFATQRHSPLQELDQEAELFKQQRQQLVDQRALLDLECKELEQRLSELDISYTLIDALWKQLDIREAILASEYETVYRTGKRPGHYHPRQ